ncbi:uncharacterized protein LOC133202134 [Saccostrea echinata]|uniref:uncharacterized protein LOC133202134 n=1 Tax=Saccostrea echinata TaxID=191078 RepID=UPI002A822362|nr:uncharacterized protein LOC133202134 [Saccostrea echinata]
MLKFLAAIVLATLIQISSSQDPTLDTPLPPTVPPTFDSTIEPPALDSRPPTGSSPFDSLPPTEPPQLDRLPPTEPPQLDRLPPTEPPQFDSLAPTEPPQFDSLPPTEPPQFDRLPPTEPPQFNRLPPAEPPQFDRLPPTEPPQFDRLPPTEPPQFDRLLPGEPRQFDPPPSSRLPLFDSPLPARPRTLNSPLPPMGSTSLDSAPPAVPSSLDNYGGNVSNYSIMYTKNLQDIMQRFKISVAEMEAMLETYIDGGNPTITKTVYNPDTGTNETVTLDFKSIAEGEGFPTEALQRPRPSARSEAPRTTDNVLNSGPVGLNTVQPTETMPNTVSSPMSEFLRNPTPVVGNAISRDSRDLDLTAFREQEAQLIDDLKLLIRRREALDESFSRGELTDENYRISLENTDIQIRDNYAVLKQIQDAIREYLGIGTPQAFSQQPPMVTPEATPIEDFRGPDSSGGQPLTPDEELVFIQSEIDRLKEANAGLLRRLQSLQMPNIDSAAPATMNDMPLNPTVGGSSLDAMNFMDSMDGAIPSPSPAPAISDLDTFVRPSRPIQGTGFPDTSTDPIIGNRIDGIIPGEESNVIPRTQIRNNIENLLNEYNRLSQREDAILRILNQNGQVSDNFPQDMVGLTQATTRPVDDLGAEMERVRENIRRNAVDTQNEIFPIESQMRAARRDSGRIATLEAPSSEIDVSTVGPQDPGVERNSFPEILPSVQDTGFPQTSSIPVANDGINEVIPGEGRNIIQRAQIRNNIENLLNEYNRLSQREGEILRTLNQNGQDVVGQTRASPVDDLQREMNLARENLINSPLDNTNDMLPIEPQGSARRVSGRIATPRTLSIEPDFAAAESQIPTGTSLGTGNMRSQFPETMNILTEDTRSQFPALDRINIVDDIVTRRPVLDTDASRIGESFVSPRVPAQTLDEISVLGTDRVQPIVDRGGEILPDSQTLSRSAQGESLIYNDGDITMSAVQPVGSLEGDTTVPIGPVVPISGFSSEASGLLLPRNDAMSLQSRQVRFFSQRPTTMDTTSRYFLQNGGRRQLRYLGGRTTLRQPLRLI